MRFETRLKQFPFHALVKGHGIDTFFPITLIFRETCLLYAGESRVAGLLKQGKMRTFDEISALLPAEAPSIEPAAAHAKEPAEEGADKRHMRLRDDIDCILERDPAARSGWEVLTCYPGLHAVWGHRLSHWLWMHNRKLLARWVSQFARWLTGPPRSSNF